MKARNRGTYEVADREMVAEGADIRIQVITLAAGQNVPWHFHSEISDSFVCLEGQTVVETKAPSGTHLLEPGQRFTVDPKTTHTVYGEENGPCKFMIIQGVGTYDFIPVGP